MMMTQYDDLNLLDDWLLRQAIEQAERRVPIDEELVPESVAQLGRVYIHLYVQTIFEGRSETAAFINFSRIRQARWHRSFEMRWNK